ncbi:MAG: winged helix-turn-helix domain-containing protein [Candidatus Kariarchaeaceae archaeon]
MEVPEVRRIIYFQPTFMKFIKDHEITELIKDKNHYPIIKLLNKQPMTVKELEEAYEEYTGKKKSNKTIYRYLKSLENAGLVRPAGNLVTTGKTATETIFSRTAMAFYSIDEKDDWWNTESARKIAVNVGILLKPLFGNKKCDTVKMIDVLKEYSKNTENQLQTLVTEVEEEITETIRECNLDEINYVLKLASSFGTFKQDTNLLNKLESCFS